MRALTSLILITLASTLAACGTDGDTEPGTGPEDTARLEIAHYLVPCVGVDRQLCMLSTDADGAQSLMYEGVEGFDFEWGQRTTIDVRIEQIANPPADGSSRRLILEDIVQSKVDRTAFDLILEGGDLVYTAHGLSLLGLIDVECATVELCASIRSQMGNPLSVKARAGTAPDDPIQIFRVM